MARNPLPRSISGTASLVERRNEIPPVDLEEDGEEEVSVDEEMTTQMALFVYQ